MNKADYIIIDYIPEFLKYCKEEKKLSNKTLENYKRFLDKFIFWLKKNNKENIKPLEITKEDVLSYQLFLSQQQDLKTGQTLKKTTQNYYSIALRAIFDYFSIKKIPTTLSANRISLLKTDKENLKKYLKINEINNLLSLPDIKKENGLRDRVILEMLISTGIKLKQLTKFNKNILDDYKNIRLPENLIFWIKKYLEIRKDDYEPLFINYRARKNATKRLTSRTIERVVKNYTENLSLSFTITPENLRSAKILSILNNEKENPAVIKNIYSHISHVVKNYEYLDKIDKNLIENTNDWHIIEKQINKETKWLEENILIMPESYRRSPDIIKCTDCLFRKIAIFIVNGKISAIEYSTTINNGLWGDKNETKDNISESITYHGKEWHRKTISVIYNYFKNKAYDILKEPLLSYGRADLGFFDPLINKMVYIEVGTVSLYKIWFNLINMKNIILLIVPSDNKLIKFIN